MTVALSGCVGNESGILEPSSNIVSHRPTVVAMLDSGLNPYHQGFQTSGVNDFQGLPVAFETISLSTEGEYEDRVASDEAVWAQVEPGRLYAFAGTHLMGISIKDPREAPLILDEGGHGTSTSSVIAETAPQVIIVMVQIDSAICLNNSCFVDSSVADGMEWIADQPWIDIVSISIGIPTNTPDPSAIHPEAGRYLAATQRAAESGKLLVTGSGNLVVPTLTDYFNGPPWMITVGAAEGAQRGEGAYYGRGVDVVANYSALAALPETVNDTAWAAGTSLSTPIVAATLATALHTLRQDSYEDAPAKVLVVARGPGGQPLDVRSENIRDALNETARYYSIEDWKPLAPSSGDPLRDARYPSLPVLVPAAQMGWGHVDGQLSAAIASYVLSPQPSAGEKDTARATQAQWQALREQYWASPIGRAY